MQYYLPMNSCILRLAAFLLGLVALAAAHAQTWPNNRVRIVSGVAPGGVGDVATRGAAEGLTKSLGQPFVIENRPGAEGMIAGEACARSAPDGYTLCLFNGHDIALGPVLRSKMPFDPARDFVPIIHLGFAAAAIIVHPSVPANSLQELFALAKSKPDSLNWASSGLASPGHLYIEYLKNGPGIRFHNVPYKSSLQGMQALVAGDIHVTTYVAGAIASQVKAGKMKALAVATSQRSPYLPEVPTFREAGMDIAILTWFGLMAPAGVPREIIQRVNSAVVAELFAVPAMRDKYLTTPGIQVEPPAGGSPEAFAEYYKAQREMYAHVVKIAGIKAQ
jgi:tripartite-type tricarboxylate transporter receptor subunit TctC